MSAVLHPTPIGTLWSAIQEDCNRQNISLAPLTAEGEIESFFDAPENRALLARIKTVVLRQVSAIPRQIGSLPGLTHLSCEGGALNSLPQEMARLTHLTHLRLAQQAFLSIPPIVGRLSALEVLEMPNQSIADLPECLNMATLPRLRYVDLTGNPIRRIGRDYQWLPLTTSSVEEGVGLKLDEDLLEEMRFDLWLDRYVFHYVSYEHVFNAGKYLLSNPTHVEVLDPLLGICGAAVMIVGAVYAALFFVVVTLTSEIATRLRSCLGYPETVSIK